MSSCAKLAEEFANIHEKEWKEARESIKNEKHDEEIIYTLMRMIRAIFDYCNDELSTCHHHTRMTSEKITEEIIHHRLPKTFQHNHITKEVRAFIQRSAHCLYAMCSSKYKLAIVWTPKGEIIEKDKFVLEGNITGSVCDWTVWPAVVDADGKVLCKGIIIPV